MILVLVAALTTLLLLGNMKLLSVGLQSMERGSGLDSLRALLARELSISEAPKGAQEVPVRLRGLKHDEVTSHKQIDLAAASSSRNMASNARFEWQEANGMVFFALVDEEARSWAELQNGEIKFRFAEKYFREDRVELFDASRDMQLVLYERQALFRYSSNHDFKQLYLGYWRLWDSKERPTPYGPYGEAVPPEPYLKGSREEQTIIILLAAFRDPLCGNTLHEAFKYASYPDRIHAAVVQQNKPQDLDCLENYCELAALEGVKCRKEQVRIMRVPLENARGVMPARFRQNLLLQGHEFCLQIDAHSAFENKWDKIAIEDWLLTRNEMAVITTYPNRVKDRHDQRYSPNRCSTKFSSDNEVVHGGNSALNTAPGSIPHLVPFFGAGTSFSKCHANINVPYDPYMSHLFGGEEFNRAVRLFTSGYDMYGPKRNFVYHYYDSDEKPEQGLKPRHREFVMNMHAENKRIVSSQTTARWRTVLGLALSEKNPRLSEFAATDFNLFGLGTRRTLEQYEAFSGVNLKQSTTKDKCRELGTMKWVPFVFEEPFFPSGEDCPYFTAEDIQEKCCTSLRKVSSSTRTFLDLTNDQVFQETKASKIAVDVLESRNGPIISPLNDKAHLLPCA